MMMIAFLSILHFTSIEHRIDRKEGSSKLFAVRLGKYDTLMVLKTP